MEQHYVVSARAIEGTLTIPQAPNDNNPTVSPPCIESQSTPRLQMLGVPPPLCDPVTFYYENDNDLTAKPRVSPRALNHRFQAARAGRYCRASSLLSPLSPTYKYQLASNTILSE